MKHSFLFFSLAALVIGGTASAQDRDQTFQDRDTNGDGVLSQGEYGGHPGNFRSLDVNGDGVLSYDEFVRRGGRVDGEQATFADPFAVMDRNNDGMITMAEWNGDRASFRQMDRDRDGLISRVEYNNEYNNNEPVLTSGNGSAWERFRVLDRNGDRVLSRREARMSSIQFNRADSDRDGVLSVREYRNSVAYAGDGTDQFASMDRNNDGVLSSYEWRGDRDTFERMDRNNDRVVTRAEYGNSPVAYSNNGAAEEFRALDRNGNGTLTRSEAGMSRSEFDRADDNRDGVLTLKEFVTNGGQYRSNGNGGFFGSILGRIEDQR